MNEALARCRHVDKRVSAGSDLAEPCAEYQQKISLLHPAGEGRVYADPDIARITGVAVVDVVLAAERGSDGKIVRLGEPGQMLCRFGRPPAATRNGQRAFRLGE